MTIYGESLPTAFYCLAPHSCDQDPPILARPIKRRRNIRYRGTRQTHPRKCLGRICHMPIMLEPWPLFRLVGLSGAQEFNPVLDPILGEHKNHLAKLLLGDSRLLRDQPKFRLQMVTILHVVVEVGPHHQRRVSASFQTCQKLGRQSRYQVFPPATIYRTDDIVSLPRANPCRLKSLQKTADEDRIDAPAFLTLVKADDLCATSH